MKIHQSAPGPLANIVANALANIGTVANSEHRTEAPPLGFDERVKITDYLSGQPTSIACQTHPDGLRRVNVHETVMEHRAGSRLAVYHPCDLCTAEAARKRRDDRLLAQGVLSNMMHCEFGNWRPQTEPEEAHLQSAKDFANRKRGFLLMLGGVGTGKSHLAVAIMRQYSDALFVKQSTLLRRLRATYSDSKQSDPIEQCQQVGLLVIDEFGFSSGGKDEVPMLYEILDHRHGNHQPTVLTSNLAWPEFKEAIGERLADRLRESAASVLTFSGASHRPEVREQYFKA